MATFTNRKWLEIILELPDKESRVLALERMGLSHNSLKCRYERMAEGKLVCFVDDDIIDSGI